MGNTILICPGYRRANPDRDLLRLEGGVRHDHRCRRRTRSQRALGVSVGEVFWSLSLLPQAARSTARIGRMTTSDHALRIRI
jgi:hypothetical protein